MSSENTLRKDFVFLLFFLVQLMFAASPVVPSDSLNISTIVEKRDYIADLKNQLEALSLPALIKEDTLINTYYCLSEASPYDPTRISALSFLGIQHFEKSEFISAKLVFEEILLKGEDQPISRPIATAHNYLSLIAELEGQFMKVYEHNKILLEYGAQKKPKWVGTVCLNLGILYLNLSEYEEAEQLFKRGIAVFEGTVQSVEYGWLLHRLGELEIVMGKPLDAIPYLTAATSFWTETNDFRANCYTTLSLGWAYKDSGDLKKAKFYYNQALKDSEANEFLLCQINALQKIGELEYELGNFFPAIESLEASINLSVAKKIPYNFKVGYEMRAKAYNAVGQVEQANKSYQEYLGEVKKSLERGNLVTKNWLADMAKFSQQKEAFQELQEEEALNRGKLNLQNDIILFGLFSLLIITWIARKFFLANKENKAQKTELLTLNKIQKEQSAKLTKANHEILQQKKELEFELTKKLLGASKQVETINQLNVYLEKLGTNNETVAMKKLILDAKNDAVWNELDLQISQANNDFFERLSKKFNLTQGELRLCALLKMNLRTKEIANLTFKNPESVKVARSRLRKKLGLTHSNIDVSAFLNQV